MLKKLSFLIVLFILCGIFLVAIINHNSAKSTASKEIRKESSQKQLKQKGNAQIAENAQKKSNEDEMNEPSEIGSANYNYTGPINTHGIEGYSDKISYYPGEKIQLKVHAPNSKFSVKMIRYGKTEDLMKSIPNISGYPQNFTPTAYETGANWKTSYEYTIPADWQSGLYAAKIFDSKSKFFVTFLIKNSHPHFKDIAVLSSTNTWEAYNDWGGKSLYSYHKEKNKAIFQKIVSFARPNPNADPNGTMGHLANGERHILNWLESNGYHYNMIADSDLNNDPKILEPYKVLIVSTHSEYWTLEMVNNLNAFLNKGGTLLYLSGNGMSWRAAIKNDQIEVMKNGGHHTLTNGMGGHLATIGLPESKILGVRYQNTGFSQPAPYRVIDPEHWIFANTGLKKGDLIGEVGLNKVKDSTGGASGWETDQKDHTSPKNLVLLAKGINKGLQGADMTYYDHPGGGGVFSVGSITFGGSLAVDKHLSQLVENVINHFNK